jgi:hypothetical protein
MFSGPQRLTQFYGLRHHKIQQIKPKINAREEPQISLPRRLNIQTTTQEQRQPLRLHP